MSRGTFVTRSAVAVALAGTLLLAGCAPDARGDAASERLDAAVVQTAERAAAGDYSGASAGLDVLESQLAEEVDDGSIDEARATDIRTAIDAVRADLAELVAAETTETPQPEAPATDTGSVPESTDPGTVETPPTDPGTVTPPATDTGNSGNGNPGNGNSGNGNSGNGNPGNGNDKKPKD